MPSKRPLAQGVALLLLALALVIASAGLRGPLNPACSGVRMYSEACFQLVPIVLLGLALPTALVGGVLVAIWMGRRAAAREEAGAGARPPED